MSKPGAGFAQRIGPGRRPALLVIDLCRGFTDPGVALGSDLDAVVSATGRLCEAARQHGAPVIYSTVEYDEAGEIEAEVFLTKVPALRILKAGSHWAEVDPRLEPQPGEPVFRKRFASAFFGTDLARRLREDGIDTLVLTGTSTSGCVRASAVDALQHGLRVLVPREAVGDRDPEAHIANLKDIDTKYGDVVDLDAALAVLASAAGPGA